MFKLMHFSEGSAVIAAALFVFTFGVFLFVVVRTLLLPRGQVDRMAGLPFAKEREAVRESPTPTQLP